MSRIYVPKKVPTVRLDVTGDDVDSLIDALHQLPQEHVDRNLFEKLTAARDRLKRRIADEAPKRQ